MSSIMMEFPPKQVVVNAPKAAGEESPRKRSLSGGYTATLLEEVVQQQPPLKKKLRSSGFSHHHLMPLSMPPRLASVEDGMSKLATTTTASPKTVSGASSPTKSFVSQDINDEEPRMTTATPPPPLAFLEPPSFPAVLVSPPVLPTHLLLKNNNNSRGSVVVMPEIVSVNYNDLKQKEPQVNVNDTADLPDFDDLSAEEEDELLGDFFGNFVEDELVAEEEIMTQQKPAGVGKSRRVSVGGGAPITKDNGDDATLVQEMLTQVSSPSLQSALKAWLEENKKEA